MIAALLAAVPLALIFGFMVGYVAGWNQHVGWIKALNKATRATGSDGWVPDARRPTPLSGANSYPRLVTVNPVTIPRAV